MPDDVARAVRAGDPVPARWRGPARLQLTAQIALLSGVFVGLVTMVAGMLSSGLLTGRPVVELMVGLLLLPAAVVAGVLRRRLTARRRLLDTDTT